MCDSESTARTVSRDRRSKPVSAISLNDMKKKAVMMLMISEELDSTIL